MFVAAARENETDQLHETKSGVAVAKFVVGSLLVVAMGVVGNRIGLPLFELTIGLGLIWYGRRHKFHVALGLLFIIFAPFIWSRLPPSMVGGATSAVLGAICVIGGVYEHRLMLREANA